jgi:transcriptional regulatory protein LevR
MKKIKFKIGIEYKITIISVIILFLLAFACERLPTLNIKKDMAKIKEFNKANLKDIRVDLNKSLLSVQEKYGIKVNVGNISFSPVQFSSISLLVWSLMMSL